MEKKKKPIGKGLILQIVLGSIPLVLFMIFSFGIYQTLLSLCTTTLDRLGCWILLLVIGINLGGWAIKLGPQSN